MPSIAYIAFLQLLASFSHTAPKCGAAGGLNFHLIPCLVRCSSIFSLLQAAIYSANSLSAPMKFVPLSLIIFTGLPLRAMNCIIGFRQQSLSGFGTITICIARTVRHVKRRHLSPYTRTYKNKLGLETHVKMSFRIAWLKLLFLKWFCDKVPMGFKPRSFYHRPGTQVSHRQTRLQLQGLI